MYLFTVCTLLLLQDASDYNEIAEAIMLRSKSTVERMDFACKKEIERLSADIDKEIADGWYESDSLAVENIGFRKKLHDKILPKRREVARLTFLRDTLKENVAILVTTIDPYMVENEGDLVIVDRIFVKQVASESAAMISLLKQPKASDFWIENVSTSTWIDNEFAIFSAIEKGRSATRMFVIRGTKTYATAAGSQRTIRKIVEIDNLKLEERLKPLKIHFLPYAAAERVEVIEQVVLEAAPKEKGKLLDKIKAAEEAELMALKADLQKLDAEFRAWTSLDGKFSTEGRILRADSRFVTLEKRDPKGTQKRVERSKLCKEDNDFIQGFIKWKVENP